MNEDLLDHWPGRAVDARGLVFCFRPRREDELQMLLADMSGHIDLDPHFGLAKSSYAKAGP
jgi:hypothetical protein